MLDAGFVAKNSACDVALLPIPVGTRAKDPFPARNVDVPFLMLAIFSDIATSTARSPVSIAPSVASHSDRFAPFCYICSLFVRLGCYFQLLHSHFTSVHTFVGLSDFLTQSIDRIRFEMLDITLAHNSCRSWHDEAF